MRLRPLRALHTPDFRPCATRRWRSQRPPLGPGWLQAPSGAVGVERHLAQRATSCRSPPPISRLTCAPRSWSRRLRAAWVTPFARKPGPRGQPSPQRRRRRNRNRRLPELPDGKQGWRVDVFGQQHPIYGEHPPSALCGGLCRHAELLANEDGDPFGRHLLLTCLTQGAAPTSAPFAFEEGTLGMRGVCNCPEPYSRHRPRSALSMRRNLG